MTKRINLLVACLLTTVPAWSQSFRYQADVDPVHQSGYQRIMLPPDVLGYLNTNMTDLRLYDADQREIPYLLTRQEPRSSAHPVNFEITSRTTIPRQATTLVLRTPQRHTLRAMTLYVGNADVSKTAQLSGSADTQQWYALRDNIRLEPATNQTTAALRINVPASDYVYYRLVISDSLTAPLNILRATYDSTSVLPGVYTAIDKITFRQRDSSDHRSYIRILRPIPTRFAQLTLRFATDTPFFRQAVVGTFRTYTGRRGRVERYFEPIQSFNIRHNVPALVRLPREVTISELYVVIDNRDDLPLRVSNVQASQVSSYLTANLSAGGRCQLRFSAEGVTAPQYDMAYFRQAIGTGSTPISVTTIRPVGVVPGDTWGIVFPRWLIWAALGTVLVVVSLLTYRMLTDVNRQNTP